MDNKSVLDLFGKQLMTSVRDRSIDKFDKIIAGTMKSSKAMELHGLLTQFDAAQLKTVRILIGEAVDNTLFNFLTMLEEADDDMQLLVKETNIVEASDGLAGELLTEDGWIESFSKAKR